MESGLHQDYESARLLATNNMANKPSLRLRSTDVLGGQNNPTTTTIPIPTTTNSSTLQPRAKAASEARAKPSLAQMMMRWWFWELLACIGSLIGVLAIVVFLIYYDHRPQPHWPRSITINTIVSLFAVLVKAPLLLTVAACLGQAKWTHFQSKRHPLSDWLVYEDASRGPLGCLNLLWILRAK